MIITILVFICQKIQAIINQKTIKNRKNAARTNWTSPRRPSPETIARIDTKIIETKNETTAELFKPKPEEVTVDSISKNDGKINIADKKRIINNIVNNNKIFLESFLSFKSEFPSIKTLILLLFYDFSCFIWIWHASHNNFWKVSSCKN